VADKTPEQRIKETIENATKHGAQSLATYETLAKAAVDHSLTKDKQADLTNDLMKLWAQSVRDVAFGWATWASLMTAYSEAAPPAQPPGGPGGDPG
jgi:hypothetical protein